MKRDLEDMSRKNYDVLIIGGGITGAAIAHDSSLRGLKTALVEKNDFGSGTTSASSKLAHGGLRYLKNLEFGLVKESLKERSILQEIVPHLISPLPFIIPTYSRGNKLKMTLGMMLYNLLSEYEMPSPKIIGAEQVIKKDPKVLQENLNGGVLYYDCQISSPERLCLEFILTATSNDADVSNYAKVEEIIIKEDRVQSIKIRDGLNGKEYNLSSKVVVNASGPWVDGLIKTYKPNHKPILKGTKGAHIITKKISNHALILTTEQKENVLILPWRNHSLIGITDDFFDGDLDNVFAEKRDIDKLLKNVNEAYGVKISEEDVIMSYAGVRPLISDGDKLETKMSRQYQIKEDVRGLITVMGGKLTTARGLAEKTVDIIINKLGYNTKCNTAKTFLYGNTEEYQLNQRDITTNKDKIIYLIENEMALTLEDVMLRRTGMATLGDPGFDCIYKVADVMAENLGWDKVRRNEEIYNLENKLKVGNK